MENEFNNYCCYYYRLKQQLLEQDAIFKNLLDNALPYKRQTKISQLDAVIACNRAIQKAKADAEKTHATLKEVESTIVMIMEYFDISPYTWLTGEITDELEFQLCMDDKKRILIGKTKDIKPPYNPNIITIHPQLYETVRRFW